MNVHWGVRALYACVRPRLLQPMVERVKWCIEIRDECMKRHRAEFRVTGGHEEATELCRLEIERDWDARTITRKQEAHTRPMMSKYDIWAARSGPTPFRVRGDKLQPIGRNEDTETSFDYAMCLGDLAWYVSFRFSD